ncbi:ubiquitin-like-specific protease 1 [Drosophila hydei]|uniref:Ubiquitin-like-specific protease 1 n=1 Tax=Drosophila hydei TaxID=7224 RepID=A0A6J1LMM8_DROHY|nr:ubiquitin-like-specific protease 1 [Drosophila hydei]
MGFDIFNWIRHWLPNGGRNSKNNKEPPNTENEDGERTRKRTYQALTNEAGAHHSIKYRRVDNTFPKFMPNDADNYCHMATANQRKEQENSSNHNAYQPQKRLSIFCTPPTRQVHVRNTQPTSPVDLSDSEDQQHNESNLYQTFADRLGSSGQPTTRPDEFGRSSSRRHNLLYSDALRYGTNGFLTNVNYQRPASSLSSSEARLNGHSGNLYESGAGRDNIMVLEEQRNEHNQYINLINNLTLHEREYARRSVNTREKEKPPPPPPLQPISLNNSDWMRAYIKNKAESGAAGLSEYAKLLNYNSKQQQQQQQPSITLGRKPPPALVQCYGPSSSSTISAKLEKPLVDKSIDVDHGKETHKSTLMLPPQTELSMSRTKALQLRNSKSIYFADNYTHIFNEKCARTQQEVNHAKNLVLQEAEKTTEERRAFEQGLRESLSKRRFISQTLFVLDKYPLEKDSEPEFIPWTDAHQQRYNELVYGKADQVLISKFSLSITRNDIRTLAGSSWLNDEVINFYMNLLTDRSQRKEGKLPSVYAMNTFFVPRLLQGGYSNVKRWTRKVDIFSKDIIPVPVHVSNVHWCMAIIHMKNKTIRYYDSMGKPNSEVLNALENYLLEESLDKRKKPFDTSDFTIENVQNVPHQTNGSDCGVFSCMFAEYITRNKPLTFSQEHMEYFRKKMALEICGGELWM